MRLIFVYFLSMIILGCSLIDFYDNCDGSTGNYGKEVGINKYYSFREYHLYVEEKFNTSKKQMEYFSHHVFFKENLELRDDSTFFYTQIWEHFSDSNSKEIIADTMEYMSGSYYIMPVEGERWHKFLLKTDSIFIKWRIQRNDKGVGSLIIDEQYHSEPFIAQHDSILLNVDLQDSCFTLAEWYQEPDDISFSCSDPYISKTRTFCANSSYKDSSIVGVVIQ